MNEFVHLYARRAAAAGVAVATVAAKDITREGHSQRQLAVAIGTGDKQSVGKVVLVDASTQLLFQFLVSYYILEIHNACEV